VFTRIEEGKDPAGHLLSDMHPERGGPADEPVDLDCFSGGEREQIFLATRLALAMELARKERQFVVLDDVLVSTDAERMLRICKLLEKLTDRLQILVLTCHPERFTELRNANRIDLRRVIHSTRQAAAYCLR
jgi:uncharacterized protein YhaN